MRENSLHGRPRMLVFDLFAVANFIVNLIFTCYSFLFYFFNSAYVNMPREGLEAAFVAPLVL